MKNIRKIEVPKAKGSYRYLWLNYSNQDYVRWRLEDEDPYEINIGRINHNSSRGEYDRGCGLMLDLLFKEIKANEKEKSQSEILHYGYAIVDMNLGLIQLRRKLFDFGNVDARKQDTFKDFLEHNIEGFCIATREINPEIAHETIRDGFVALLTKYAEGNWLNQ